MDVTRTDPPDRIAGFEALFRRHYEELTRFAIRRVGPDAAADVVAATFLTAWRRCDDIPAEHPRAWLFATARHTIGNELRSGYRRDRLAAKAERADQPYQHDHAPAVIEQQDILAALDQLSEPDGEILRLTAWEELDINEIAQVLGCTRNAAKVRLHRARRRLAAQLATTTQAARTATETKDQQATVTERNLTP